MRCGSVETSRAFSTVFSMEQKFGDSSIFAGTAIECMEKSYLGEKGHIAIGTNNVERVIYHLGLDGMEFDETTRKTDAKGHTTAIYVLDKHDGFGGFAVHLARK